MGLCGLSSKPTAIIAGIFTLLQGLFWCVIGILALLVYSCSINISDVTPQFYRLYLVYLYSGKCGSEEIEVLTDNGTVVVTWPRDGVITSGIFHSWILVYFTCSLAWVVAALLLMIATFSEVRGPRGVMLRSPWLVLTSVFVILDVIVSVLYAIDISHTTNLEDLLEFVGVSVDSDIQINSSSTSSAFGYLTMASSILVLTVFSRLLLGWALNLSLLVHVARDARNGESSEPVATGPEPREPYQQYLHKLSTIGPVPDVKWDPYQRKRSELPVLKPLEVPSPTNERKRKQSDYQQYMFYAKNPSGLNYLDDIISEPPTPAVRPDPTTGVWQFSTPQAENQGNLNSFKAGSSAVPIPAPDYEGPGSVEGNAIHPRNTENGTLRDTGL